MSFIQYVKYTTMISEYLDSTTMHDGYKLLLSTMCFEYNVFLRLGCILKYAVEMEENMFIQQ